MSMNALMVLVIVIKFALMLRVHFFVIATLDFYWLPMALTAEACSATCYIVWHFKFILDINECETGTNNCQHTCLNNDGSFYCLCDPGFRLNYTTNATCDGR